jgi:hypothetical protein
VAYFKAFHGIGRAKARKVRLLSNVLETSLCGRPCLGSGVCRCISTLHWSHCPRNGRRRKKTCLAWMQPKDAIESEMGLKMRFWGVLAPLIRMLVPNGQVSQGSKVKS